MKRNLFLLILLTVLGAVAGLLAVACMSRPPIPDAPPTRAGGTLTPTFTFPTHIPSLTLPPFHTETPTNAPTDAATISPPPSVSRETLTPTNTRAMPTFSPTVSPTNTVTETRVQTPTDFATLSPSITPIHLASETPTPQPPPATIPDTGLGERERSKLQIVLVFLGLAVLCIGVGLFWKGGAANDR